MAARVIDNTAVLIQPASAEIRGLNRTASHLWTYVAAPRTIEEMAAELVRAFDVGLETAREDAANLVTELLSRSLIEEVPSEP